MTETPPSAPRMIPRQLGFFSDWFVEVIWPDGGKERVTGFTSEAHARGWIEHEARAWVGNALRGGRR